MQYDQKDNKRIAKNTIYLYFRMFITMAVGIYASRVVLATLGESDYGIYNVVGGFVGMFAMVSASMAAATQRFLSFEIGKKENGDVKAVFSNSVIIHVILALIILIVAETIGLWFVNEKMNFPEGRYDAANVVYQFSVLTFLINIISVPYNAALIAFEHMKAFAYVTIVEAVLKLLIVYLLIISPFDGLVLYSALYSLVAILIRLLYGFYVKKNVKACSCDWHLHKSKLSQMVSFAGWNMFGATAGVASDQGINVVLNIFFGVTINAARGISMQIYAAIKSFVSNFQLAASPQIIKLYASGRKKEMLDLVFNMSRFSFILMMIIGLPIIFGANFILNLWLVEPPMHSVAFVQISLLSCLGYALSQPLSYAMHASGKVKNYQIVVGCTSILCLPVTYLVLRFGRSPESAFWIALAFEFISMITKLIMLRQMIGISFLSYMRRVVIRSYFLLAVSVVLPILFTQIMGTGWGGFILMGIICEFSVLSSVLVLGLSKQERKVVFDKTKKIFIR